MPFSKYDIDPEHIETMRAAFHRVCDVLQLDCDREDSMTEIVVTKIVELAKASELDPERLCTDTLAALELPESPRSNYASSCHARLAGAQAAYHIRASGNASVGRPVPEASAPHREDFPVPKSAFFPNPVFQVQLRYASIDRAPRSTPL
jgi:hypothetical protein